MGGSTNTGRRCPCRRRAELLVLSLACLSIFPHSPAVVAALIVDPTLLARTTGRGAFARGSRRVPTRLQTKYAEDDFASFGDFDREGQGRQLAHEFYQEVEQRQKKSSRVSLSEDDGLARGRQSPNEDGGKRTIRAVRISADGGAPSRRFANQPAESSDSPGEGFPLSLFPFFSVPAPAPTSAGLFSGSGNTVYSSGRSVRAEIEILETTMKNSEGSSGGWDGIYVANPEQLEEVLRLVALSLLMVGVVYVAVEASGDIAVILDGAASSANHAMNLMSDATKDGVSSIMIGVGNGEVFMGEEAAWLMKESSDLAASVAEAEFRVNFKYDEPVKCSTGEAVVATFCHVPACENLRPLARFGFVDAYRPWQPASMSTMEGSNGDAEGAAGANEENAELAAMLVQAAEILLRQGEHNHPVLIEATDALVAYTGSLGQQLNFNNLKGFEKEYEEEAFEQVEMPPLKSEEDSSADKSCSGWTVDATDKDKGDLTRFIALFSEVHEAWEQWEADNPWQEDHSMTFTDLRVVSNRRFVEFLWGSGYKYPWKYCKIARLLNDNSEKFGTVGSMVPGTLTQDHGFIMATLVTGRSKKGVSSAATYARRNPGTRDPTKSTDGGKGKRTIKSKDEKESKKKRNVENGEEENGGD